MAARRKRESDYRRLLAYAARDRRGWAAIIGVTLLSTPVTLLTPWPLKVLVDSVLGDKPTTWALSWLPGSGHVQALLVYVVLSGVLVFALAAVLDVLLTILWVRVGQGMVYEFDRDLFAAVQRKSLRFHGRHSVGERLTRVTTDSWVVHDVVDTLLFSPIHNGMLLVGMSVLLGSMDLRLTLVTLLVAPVLMLSSRLLGRPVRRAGEAKRQIDGLLRTHVHQTLTGIPVVQAFGQESRHQDEFAELSRQAVAAEQRTMVVSNLNRLASGVVSVAGRGLVLFLGAREVLDGRLTIGGLIVFLAYLQSLQNSLTAFAGIYPALQKVRPQIDRVMEVLEPAHDVAAPGRPVPLPHVRGHVWLRDVVFGYDAGDPVLHGVDLEAHPGETVGIVGATGAGKSTLVSLLMRFYDPQSGCVTLDGVDLRDLDLRTLRSNVSWLSQDAMLFPVSIADNIAYGRPQASRADVVAAATAANADTFIRALPDGYETIVGERGSTLSGGERQRIAIARALLKNAPVLVLDEPTSALDASTERALLVALDRLMAGRTTFVIAHRLSTIRDADLIYVMDHGRVIECGRHWELMLRRGTYARLVDLQAGPAVDVTERVVDITEQPVASRG